MTDLYSPYGALADAPGFTVTSTDVAPGATFAAAQLSSALGSAPVGVAADISPQLAWTGFPEETQSFAITVFDPDAPTGSGFWHWAVANIPADVTELSSGAGGFANGVATGWLPAGAVTLRSDAGQPGFVGAAPPAGHGPHRYFITVTAVDVPALEIAADSPPAVLGFNLFFHTLARATLVATYEQH